ncbi:MAG: chromate transporter [Melioribacter sp.]|jgi:chromate transporter|uniref:chromate transporter n=1 Tax=Melioribacter sp. TaxID=2052167 RepID=UPI003BE6C1F3
MIESLVNLFWAFVKVGSFSFGGAYSLIPLIEKEVVKNHQWLTQDEFLKVLGMVEIFPGAISIKFATYTGYKTAGIAGAVAANLGNILTPAVLILLFTYIYSIYEKNILVAKAFNGIKYAVIGMIAAIMYQYAVKNGGTWQEYLILGVGAALVVFFKLHPAYVVIIAAIIGMVLL